MKQRLSLIAILSALCLTVHAELLLNTLFTDNMVLQRDMPVPIWGTGAPGATITVEFAGQKKTAQADPDGKWKVTLKALTASKEPRELSVTSSIGNQKSAISNVLVGEVWICSGQSNMQMGYGGIPDIKALVPSAKNIRSFEVKRTVAFEKQDTCEGHWQPVVPESAIAFSFAYSLQAAADVPVGIILTCWGSSSLEAWMPRELTATVPHFNTLMKEFDADPQTHARIQAILDGPQPFPRKDDIFLRRQSNLLYNAMMHPLIPYACRGLVWYQGERNTQSMFGMIKEPWFARHSGMLKYAPTLQAWMKQLRSEWQREDFHFLVVMLPRYYKPLPTGPQGEGPESPNEHSWGWMRESQLKALALPHTSVANTIDLGDIKNIHPKDKLPVGQRLALLAERDTLSMNVEAQGPVMSSVTRHNNQLIVHFHHAEGLKTRDGTAPKGFWLADESGKWVPATATLAGQTVALQAPTLPNPLYVRYAFAGAPTVNMVNEAGLPAYPFRTDTFSPEH